MIGKLKNLALILWEDLLKSLNLQKIASYSCKGCSKKLSSRVPQCPYCCSSSRRIELRFTDTVRILDSFFHARLKRNGFKKFVMDLVHRYKSSGDKRLKEGVYEERVMDKEKDLYEQLVFMVKNGKVGKLLHKDIEKLSDHKDNSKKGS